MDNTEMKSFNSPWDLLNLLHNGREDEVHHQFFNGANLPPEEIALLKGITESWNNNINIAHSHLDYATKIYGREHPSAWGYLTLAETNALKGKIETASKLLFLADRYVNRAIDRDLALLIELNTIKHGVINGMKSHSPAEVEKIAKKGSLFIKGLGHYIMGLMARYGARLDSKELIETLEKAITIFSSESPNIYFLSLCRFEISFADIPKTRAIDMVNLACEEFKNLSRTTEVQDCASRLNELHTNKLPTDRIQKIGDTIFPPTKLMLAILEKVRRVAPYNYPVLLLGDEGTGKEGIAKAIHQLSDRHEGKFIAVNCSTLRGDIVMSELFGSKPGAFTGAVDKKGYFEEANNGTIFLDEFAELPLQTQAALLRTLQEGEIQRVGTATTTKINVRVIAATNKDIYSLVKKGLFRSDLLHRIDGVMRITIPPLRERQDEILLFAEEFLERDKRNNVKYVLDNSARIALKSRPYPGNIRELDSLIKRAKMNANSEVSEELLERGSITISITDHHLNNDSHEYVDNDTSFTNELIAAQALLSINSVHDIIPLEQMKRKIEKVYIKAALRVTNGNKKEALRLLGISRTWLFNLLKQDSEDFQFNDREYFS